MACSDSESVWSRSYCCSVVLLMWKHFLLETDCCEENHKSKSFLRNSARCWKSFFVRLSVCWFVTRITKKLTNGFPLNLDGGCVSAQNRSCYLLVWIQECFLTFFNIQVQVGLLFRFLVECLVQEVFSCVHMDPDIIWKLPPQTFFSKPASFPEKSHFWQSGNYP